MFIIIKSEWFTSKFAPKKHFSTQWILGIRRKNIVIKLYRPLQSLLPKNTSPLRVDPPKKEKNIVTLLNYTLHISRDDILDRLIQI